jgi:hypothetical protein
VRWWLIGPERWLRWKNGVVFIGDANSLDPTLDGPGQDSQVAEGVTLVEQLADVASQFS